MNDSRADGAESQHGAERDDQTIQDFGEQWAWDSTNDGFYGSLELFQDILGPLVNTTELDGVRAGDVGSGAGRIVQMLLRAGATHVVAVEPSSAVEALAQNLREHRDQVEIIHGTVEALPTDRELDVVTAIGVLQFIPDLDGGLRAILRALRPGGRVILWVYSREGMGAYLAFLSLIRSFTPRLPHTWLLRLCGGLERLLAVYTRACRVVPLPLADYLLHTFSRLDRDKRVLTIYDQLNPTRVHYYSREEIVAAVTRAGFTQPRTHHRRGYSWTVVAERP